MNYNVHGGTTSITEWSETENSIEILVSPTVNSGDFNVKLNADKTERVKLAVFNTSGQMMQILAKDQLVMNGEWLDFQVDLPTGTYLIGVFGEDGKRGVAKFIVVK